MKKPAASKRAAFPRAVDYARPFVKDLGRLSRSGRYDLGRLKEAMLLLMANDAPLGPEWRDHPLKGGRAGYRECHVGGDFLLIYQVRSDVGQGGGLVFERTGTHSELFDG